MPASGYESYGEPLDLEKNIIIDDESAVKSADGLVRDPAYGYQGPKVDIKSLNWRMIDGPFVSVWLHNVPWGAEDTKAAPDAEVYYSIPFIYSSVILPLHCNFAALLYCFNIKRYLSKIIMCNNSSFSLFIYSFQMGVWT